MGLWCCAMIKTKLFNIRFTQEQMKILEARTINAGFTTKSDYIRDILFRKIPLEQQLEELIHVLKIKTKQKQNNKYFR